MILFFCIVQCHFHVLSTSSKQAMQPGWGEKEKDRDKELAEILTQMLKTSRELNPECLTPFSVTAQRILTLGSSCAISKGKELCCLMQTATATAAEISLC